MLSSVFCDESTGRGRTNGGAWGLSEDVKVVVVDIVVNKRIRVISNKVYDLMM